jgi:3-hydroxyisobutyrate dehydrogenase-like beta-hydroxyacid dehydrogenase
MQMGMIGLGRMGAGMVRRLMRAATTASSTTSTPTPSHQSPRKVRSGCRLSTLWRRH